MAINAKAPIDARAMDKHITSRGDKRMLGIGLHGWEQLMLLSLAGAGVAAVAVGIATFAVVGLTREENLANAEALGTYKADAGKLIADAQSKAATANERAERLKQQLAWREISPSQQEKITAVLEKTPFNVTISWVAGDSEGSEFARSIFTSLIRSGMKIDAFASMVFLGNEPHGLHVSGSNKDEVRLLVESLRKASLGTVFLKYETDGKKYVTHIRVGYRERPTLPSE